MDLSDHVEGLREALGRAVEHGRAAGLDAAVPTTPGWSVRQLVSHLGGVHRWASGHLRGRPERSYDDAAGLAEPDPLAWLAAGGEDLLRALAAAPADLQALVFLDDAPAPLPFWARRQCHETTIHAVDALAASLGRPPRAADTWIRTDLALDGVDELLTGFLTRSRSPLRSEQPVTIGVRASDADRAWTVRVSSERAVTTRTAEEADVVLEAPAATLYLALWNRSEEIDVPALWRRTARVG